MAGDDPMAGLRFALHVLKHGHPDPAEQARLEAIRGARLRGIEGGLRLKHRIETGEVQIVDGVAKVATP